MYYCHCLFVTDIFDYSKQRADGNLKSPCPNVYVEFCYYPQWKTSRVDQNKHQFPFGDPAVAVSEVSTQAKRCIVVVLKCTVDNVALI